MSETCFTHCVDNFNTRSLDLEEEKCVEKCIGKYISFNHRVLGIYADAQQKVIQKRIAEQEEASKEQIQVTQIDDTTSPAVETNLAKTDE